MARNFFMGFLLVLAHSLSVTTGAHPGKPLCLPGWLDMGLRREDELFSRVEIERFVEWAGGARRTEAL
ncbi:MAG: hypothetical protein ABSE77_14915 [Acidimicrobiales bacterium]|jgi:hypothetical protein